MKRENNISPFKFPEGYFENFEQELFNKIAVEKFPQSGFKVPDTYFEKIDLQLLDKIKKDTKKSGKVILIPRKILGYAATLAAILVLGFFLFDNNSESKILDSIQVSTIDRYIEEGNLDLDLYEITFFLEDSDISVTDLQTQSLSPNALEDYLMEDFGL